MEEDSWGPELPTGHCGYRPLHPLTQRGLHSEPATQNATFPEAGYPGKLVLDQKGLVGEDGGPQSGTAKLTAQLSHLA